ncbi:LysR family transcriptional regulator [Arthrobacter mobilis]|uniref:LysR family transcriptional regulator n=1 Tax=Arthrobacter mobilis TaxID=2724944 RepID=A0A7X6HDJ8_9MICC|nr:LysR family transcriptional regulator [Arthrobacter mobilis]NKX55159.1 LysR family transcriptional regulator [Arthrobacter mobilis]
MPKPFTIVQLRYFAAVAESENMTAAAERLGITQSALSTAIGQLEQALEVQLFIRRPQRGLHLTPSGRQFAKDLGPFLEQADALYESARGYADALVGELKVGVFAPLAPFRAPVILQAFEARYPGVHVSFLEGDQEFLRRSLLEGHCELALMYNLGLDGGFTTRTVERIPPHVLVSADHRLAARPEQEVALRELADEPMILLDLPHTREYFMQLFQLAGITPTIRHRASGYETVRSFVARGHGYAVLNQRLHHDLTYAGGRVVPLRLTDDLPGIEVLLVRPEGLKPTRRALAFEDVCRGIYGT